MVSRWLIYHIASGESFFSGAIAILCAVAVSQLSQSTGRRIVRNLLALAGAAGVILSSIPLGVFPALVLIAVGVLWITAEAFRQRLPQRLLACARAIMAGAWCAFMIVEAYYYLPREIPLPETGTIAIIGDSVTAGIDGPNGITWPKLLAAKTGLTIHDRSTMGATAASAIKQVAELSPSDRLVLIEIGGNDLLGDSTPVRFAADLDALLTASAKPGRTLVMFELPLPPFSNQYGREQRRLAHKHRVVLIPKRILLGVLLAGGATTDSIHLSASGHRAMADVVDQLLGRPRNPSDD